MGLFGRPQTFWPMRRSILYFASWRLVIASSCRVAVERIAPSSVPAVCRNRQVLAEAPAQHHGSRNATPAQTAGAAGGFEAAGGDKSKRPPGTTTSEGGRPPDDEPGG